MTIFDFTAKDVAGNEIALSDFKGDVVLIVNTASKCGFTPQYADLQKLHEKFENHGLSILGFPCNQFMDQEPGSSQEAKAFCTLNYGVTFPIFEKVDVNGTQAHPLFKYLMEQAPFQGFDMSNVSNKILEAMLIEKFPQFTIGNAIRWNFTKFLVDRSGKVVKRYEPSVEPMALVDDIKNLL